MIRALPIGRPSSEKPIAPASRSSTISVSSAPRMPRVTVAVKPTGTDASLRARSWSASTSVASETVGSVLAIATIPR